MKKKDKKNWRDKVDSGLLKIMESSGLELLPNGKIRDNASKRIDELFGIKKNDKFYDK